MTTLGKTIAVRGELRSVGSITIEGRIDGPLFCDAGDVLLTSTSIVNGDIVARDITVFGRVAGQLIATGVVDLRADATVTGDVMSSRFLLDPAAQFSGRVEPQHLEAAVRVARFKQRQRDAEGLT